MTVSQINQFCGNPNNHDAHSHGNPVPFFWCDGVSIEKEDVYIEKYDPTEQAMDGTPYSEITITIRQKDGTVTTIHAPKASFLQFEVEHNKYVAIDQVDHYQTPSIEKAVLSFQPYQLYEGDEAPFTIERKKADET